jgi:hypothetical protein
MFLVTVVTILSVAIGILATPEPGNFLGLGNIETLGVGVGPSESHSGTIGYWRVGQCSEGSISGRG